MAAPELRSRPSASAPHRCGRGTWWIGIVGVLAVALPGALALGISYQGERELGQRFDLATRQRVPMIEDPEVIGYVGAVGNKIVGGLDDSFFDYQEEAPVQPPAGTEPGSTEGGPS